jgi:flagellar basal body-associated protein FliL
LLLSKEEPCIKISSEYQDNKKSSLFIIIIIASLILLCLLSASIYFQFKANQELYKQFDLLKNVGLVRKTMTYLNLFAFNVAKTHNDPSYISLVTSTAAEFYKVSSLTYP